MDRLRAIVQDAHVHLLVGAGTSAGLCAPLGDIENALEALDEADTTEPARALARASIQVLFFEQVLWPNIALVEGPDGPAERVVRSYERLLRTLNVAMLNRRSALLPKRVSLFTTNVDLAFEVAGDRLGLVINDGFIGRFVQTYDSAAFGTLRSRLSPRFGNRFEVPSFDLMKVHGSVGWIWTDAAAISFERDLATLRGLRSHVDVLRDHLVPLEDATTIDSTKIVEAAERLVATESSERDDMLASFAEAYDQLVIVQPEKTKFAKTVLTETYYELIRLMANELERETSVLFVHGFSFRDEHLRQILLRAARSNPTLQLFVFCYAPDDRDKYADLIAETAVPNGNIEYVVPEGDLRYDLDTVVSQFFEPLLDPSALRDLESKAAG